MTSLSSSIITDKPLAVSNENEPQNHSYLFSYYNLKQKLNLDSSFRPLHYSLAMDNGQVQGLDKPSKELC